MSKRQFGVGTAGFISRQSNRQLSNWLSFCLDSGVTFFDTADSYCRNNSDFGRLESVIYRKLGSMIKNRKITVGTKGGLTRPYGRQTLIHPNKLIRACEESLARSGLDALPLYQIHFIDSKLPLELYLSSANRLLEQGKIQRLGFCNIDLRQLRQAAKALPVFSIQNQFNLWDQKDRRSGLIEFCAKNSIQYQAYSPLGGGQFYDALSTHPKVIQMCEDFSVEYPSLVMAWLKKSKYPIFPILGSTNIAHLRSSFLGPRHDDKISPRLSTLNALSMT